MIDLRKTSKSIVTRLILFGLAIALVTATGRYFMMTDFLREDLAKVVSIQQEALVNYVARDIDLKISGRLDTLNRLAEVFPLELIEKPSELRIWLQRQHKLQPLFSEGLLVSNIDGVVITDYPQLEQRAGSNSGDSDYIRAALGGQSTIGRVVMASTAIGLVVPMAVPIKDASGNVRAVLAGITATAATGFLDLLHHAPIGLGGGFLIVAPTEQIFVAATKPELVMRATPAPGVNPLHDKALKGGKGSGVTVNAQGVEEIAAYAPIPSTGWFAVARIPTAEAFLSVARAQQYVLRNAVIMIGFLISILVIGLTYIFRPLATAADHASRMTNGEMPFAPLPVVREDEVGHLTAAFNKLLEKLLRSREDMQKKANHDPLTGLPNRLLLADRMSQALARSDRNGTGLAVLFLDLDGFKPINDRMGHDAGDKALIEIANRLSSIVREADTVARVGGDEFVIVISDLDKSSELARTTGCAIAEKCLEAIAVPIEIKGESQIVGFSIGIAFGDRTSTVDELLSGADSAMYLAKQQGKGRYVVADSTHSMSSGI